MSVWWEPTTAEVEAAAADLYESSTGRTWANMLNASTRSECATARSMWRMRARTALCAANKLAFARMGLTEPTPEPVPETT